MLPADQRAKNSRINVLSPRAWDDPPSGSSQAPFFVGREGGDRWVNE
jgi:hypothetical protein